MAPIKRKRPHDEALPLPPRPPQPTVTRRATRQTPIPPPQIPKLTQALPPPAPVSPPAPAKRGRQRTVSLGKPSSAGQPRSSNPVVPPKPKQAPLPLKPIEPPGQEHRVTRHRAGGPYVESVGIAAKENVRPANLVAPDITYPAQGPTRSASLVRPNPPLQHPARPNKPPPQVTAVPIPIPIITQKPPPPHSPPQEKLPEKVSEKLPDKLPDKLADKLPENVPEKTPESPDSPRPDRNIDKVVLGNICFKAWYPSFYGKEVLGEITGNREKGVGATNEDKAEIGAKMQSRRDRDVQILLERLYVCPCCFKYSIQLVPWWEHVRVCERSGHIPGRRIYTHPKGRRLVKVPAGPGRGRPSKKGDGPTRFVEGLAHDEGEWSIWEVDGEQELLFCQNLSLFAKLFLDNKSVFFDVTGFNYFLLVYTPPLAAKPKGGVAEDNGPRHHVTGFFSKEKMSWDNNNLACILVFPPWQRKGLGSLLMGVSYEISRREGILGGPEKPISDLGKRGYKRFWTSEVARWLLGMEMPEKEILVDVDDCSRATWIAVEDCLSVLRDMGVVEDAGMGPSKPEEKDDAEEGEPEPEPEPEGEAKEVKMVQRVKIDKEALRKWVKANGISLERTCDADGFVEGYAMKITETGEDES